MNEQADNTAFYISVISGGLLMLSETLPYLSKVKGNSILQVILELVNKKQQEVKTEQNKLDVILEKLDEVKKILETNKPV